MSFPPEIKPYRTPIGESTQSATYPLALIPQNRMDRGRFASSYPLKSSRCSREPLLQTAKTTLQAPRKTIGVPNFPHRTHRLSPTRF